MAIIPKWKTLQPNKNLQENPMILTLIGFEEFERDGKTGKYKAYQITARMEDEQTDIVLNNIFASQLIPLALGYDESDTSKWFGKKFCVSAVQDGKYWSYDFSSDLRKC